MFTEETQLPFVIPSPYLVDVHLNRSSMEIIKELVIIVSCISQIEFKHGHSEASGSNRSSRMCAGQFLLATHLLKVYVVPFVCLATDALEQLLTPPVYSIVESGILRLLSGRLQG